MLSMVWKLKSLKQVVKKWKVNKKHKMKEYIHKIEQEIESIYTRHNSGILYEFEKVSIYNLEGIKLDILNKEEAFWRKKSWALWLALGDLNTKYFHNYANHHRVINVIWELANS